MKNKDDYSQAPVDRYEIYKKMQALTYTVGSRLKKARIEKNLSRKQIEKDLENQIYLNKVELGIFGEIDSIIILIDYLQLDIAELFKEPFQYFEKPSYGAICRENKILKKMLDNAQNNDR